MMTEKEIEYLKSHPKCVEIEFPPGSGEKRPWLESHLSLQALKRHGIEPHELKGSAIIKAEAEVRALVAHLKGDEGDEEALLAAHRQIPVEVFTRYTAIRLYAGLVTFDTPEDPAPSLDFCYALVDATNWAEIGKSLNDALGIKPPTEEAALAEIEEGKGDAPKPAVRAQKKTS